MKRYETPQAAEVGQASELVLGEKFKPERDSIPGGIPDDLNIHQSVVDTDN